MNFSPAALSTPTHFFFGHHKCASRYLIAITQDVAAWMGIDYRTHPGNREIRFDFNQHMKSASQAAAISSFCYIDNPRSQTLDALAQLKHYRGFHLIRDPRDIIVSGYFSHLYSHPLYTEKFTTWRKILTAIPSIEESLLTELDLAQDFLARIAGWRYDDPNIYEARYESLIADPHRVFVEAFRFMGLQVPRLGLPTLAAHLIENRIVNRGRRSLSPRRCLPQPALARILARHSFTQKSGGRKPGEENVKHHYRKGIAGDWRNYFTPRVTQAFKERYGEMLIQLGYESSLDW